MSAKLIVSEDAQKDIRKIVQWYDTQQEGLGGDFYQKLLLLFAKISENPSMYGFISNQIRVATTRKFPHACYFSSTPEEITIIAIQHGRRSDRHWKRRLK